MAKREIKIRSFVWQEKFEDFDGKTRVRNRMAAKGAVVDLDDHWVAYGEDMGAFVTDEDREAAASEEESDLAETVSEMGPDELMNWVSDATIPQIMGVAKANPDMINDLLDAENKATGNDPRTGLVEGLAHLAGSGEAAAPPEESAAPEVTDEAAQLAEKLGIDLSKLAEEADLAEGEALTVDDVKEAFEEVADATDAAKKLADEKDIYLADVEGTGKDGRITEPDVQKVVDAEENAG